MRLVEKIFVFFRMKMAGIIGFTHRVFAMLINAGTGSILADAEPAFGVFRVYPVGPGSKFSQLAIIPTEIPVEGI